MTRPILVIEDNEQNLYLMRYLLESDGFEVAEARDGRAGIALAGRIDPLAIVLDIQLPALDGYAVTGELRRNQDLDGVPIIAVTSYAMVGDRERCLAAGATGYLEKPIDPDTFVAQIKAYLPGEPTGLRGEGVEHVEHPDRR
ncbi:MAG: response regulator [Gemmataceae bacterium]